jgi:hypothetical protein
MQLYNVERISIQADLRVNGSKFQGYHRKPLFNVDDESGIMKTWKVSGTGSFPF